MVFSNQFPKLTDDFIGIEIGGMDKFVETFTLLLIQFGQ